MKKATLELNSTELLLLAKGLERLLGEKPTSRPDEWNRQLLELGLRFHELAVRPGTWISIDVLRAKWAVPYLRKALADASETSTLRLKVTELQARVKQLTTPKPRPKPRPKKKLPAKVLPHAAPSASPALVRVDESTSRPIRVGRTVVTPLPRAVEKDLDTAFGTPEP